MKDNLFIPVFTLLIVILMLGGLVGIALGARIQLENMREAYKTCLVSHYEVSGDSEQACGNALDATSTEFMCNQDGTHCWLEVK